MRWRGRSGSARVEDRRGRGAGLGGRISRGGRPVGIGCGGLLAPGDFAQAYVIAHEVGHHVQNLMGINAQVERARRSSSRARANELSVKMELQADCLAGVWAHHAHTDRQLLEPGDVEEGLGAASEIGDDSIQRSTTGRIQPESWTHGSSEQRVAWLRRGIQLGDLDSCDTFQ